MSGLAGVFHRDGRPVDEAAIWSMLAAAPYRGPDGMSVYRDACVGLGHARFIVTPGDEWDVQPLVSQRTGCVIIADVRLDNRDELIACLGDRLPANVSDAELMLRLYETFGAEAAARMLGDFAYLIWDPRHRRIVCATDTSGQRGLYYRCNAQVFAAASEIQQLLQDPAVPVQPSEERLLDFLTPFNLYGNEREHPLTFFDGIFALPAGHLLVADESSLTVSRYWEFPASHDVRYRSPDEYAEHFREIFAEAVRVRLRSIHPVGVLLSGGLDSSSIACVAQELYRAGQATDHGFMSLSVTYGAQECDERGLIQDVVDKYGFASHEIESGRISGRLQLRPGGFLEAPNLGIADIRDSVLSVAQDAGVRVLLRGDVADACIGGSYLVFDSLLRQLRFSELLRYLQSYRRSSHTSLRRIAGLYCLAPLLPLPAQRRVMAAHVRREHERGKTGIVPDWMPAELRQRLRKRDLDLATTAELQRRFSNPAREMEFRYLYPPEVARQPGPWPVQLCRPFADRRLHEFLLAIPPETKFRPHPDTDDFYAGSKQLIRQGLQGILPESIRTRTQKTTFRAAFANEIQSNWGVYEDAFGPGSDSEIAARGYVMRDRFWANLQSLREGTPDRRSVYVMEMLGLETWLRSFRLPRDRQVMPQLPAGTRSAAAPATGPDSSSLLTNAIVSMTGAHQRR
jgi:asparagine synthase (glutamine-hydrolysing)